MTSYFGLIILLNILSNDFNIITIKILWKRLFEIGNKIFT